MKNNTVIILISVLSIGAAALFAELMSANGEGAKSVAPASDESNRTQPVRVQLEEKQDKVGAGSSLKQASSDSANLAEDTAANQEQTEQTSDKSKVEAATGQNVATDAISSDASPDVSASKTPVSSGQVSGAEKAQDPEIIKVAEATQPSKSVADSETNSTPAAYDSPPMAPSLYERARWHPIHFRPMIENATNDQCLACHSEVLTRKVRETSPAGVKASQSLAWYQTLDTYAGDQLTFHQRHMLSPFSKQVMNLQCNFCHQGHDPREEAPGSSATAPSTQTDAFTLRKVVNPSKSCLLCHGKFSYEIMALGGPWHEVRKDLEDPQDPDLRNGCLTCHNMEGGFRTVRHQVSYLKADEIERLAKEGSSDVCYGCHGGRSWFRISNPYPRHPWPGMDPEVPEWAKDRPTESDPRYALEKK